MTSRVKFSAKSREANRMSAKRITFVFLTIILIGCDQIHPSNAILNCFTPNMFKMSKGGQPLGYGGAERTNWYPQQQLPFQPGYANQVNYGHHPMKLLFQPKWKGGSLFGSKGWNNWKTGANSNFYRPSYGYGPSVPGPTAGYPFNEQLNVAPFVIPSQNINPYSGHNDGWSAPSTYNQVTPIQQTQLNGYDSYTQPSALIQPSKQQVITPVLDPYGTKGGISINNKLTTTKNILLANGGYGSYDFHLVDDLRNHTYGYVYPDWYFGVVDSPAKIAQQLLKVNLRNQRLQSHQNRSAPLLQSLSETRPMGGTNNQFTIFDEPRFVGFGTIDVLNTKEARLSCSFNEAINQTNRPLWIKFLGPYNNSQLINSKIVPPFNCANSQCRTQEIESTKDHRYRFDNGPATSTLIISEPRLSDYGIYRCSALTKAINNNPLETIYQIIQIRSLK